MPSTPNNATQPTIPEDVTNTATAAPPIYASFLDTYILAKTALRSKVSLYGLYERLATLESFTKTSNIGASRMAEAVVGLPEALAVYEETHNELFRVGHEGFRMAVFGDEFSEKYPTHVKGEGHTEDDRKAWASEVCQWLGNQEQHEELIEKAGKIILQMRKDQKDSKGRGVGTGN